MTTEENTIAITQFQDKLDSVICQQLFMNRAMIELHSDDVDEKVLIGAEQLHRLLNKEFTDLQQDFLFLSQQLLSEKKP